MHMRVPDVLAVSAYVRLFLKSRAVALSRGRTYLKAELCRLFGQSGIAIHLISGEPPLKPRPINPQDLHVSFLVRFADHTVVALTSLMLTGRQCLRTG